MSVEQVARDFISKMTDTEELKRHITADATTSGGILPKPMPLMDALGLLSGLFAAMPDLKWEVQQVMVNGNQATVDTVWGGTQSGPLTMSMPGMPAMPTIPPSGKKVSVKDTYVITVEGDKVSQMQVNSPADGGIPAALAQLGVQMPGM